MPRLNEFIEFGERKWKEGDLEKLPSFPSVHFSEFTLQFEIT